jgi:shikimate dehydrogenase
VTDKYAVIGHPIGHSKSPLIHAAFARQCGQDIEYTAIDSPPDDFARTLEAFRAGGGRGANITMPFKVQAFERATERLERAQLAGATNVLKIEGERVVCDNFDGVGLVNDIQRNLGVSLAGRRVLMLGAGGAVRGALQPILAQWPAAVVVANRNVEKAKALAKTFAPHGRITACGYTDLAGERFDVVINATSASLTAEVPAVPPSVFGADGLAYEMVYGKGLTPFLRLAREQGVTRLADGVGMLAEQAAEAFRWWRGVRPETRSVIDAIKVPLV